MSTTDKLSTKLADRQPGRLTKADTVALWYAVDSYVYAVRAMRDMAGITPEQLAAEEARLLASKRALRKVNALRKQQAARAPAKIEAACGLAGDCGQFEQHRQAAHEVP